MSENNGFLLCHEDLVRFWNEEDQLAKTVIDLTDDTDYDELSATLPLPSDDGSEDDEDFPSIPLNKWSEEAASYNYQEPENVPRRIYMPSEMTEDDAHRMDRTLTPDSILYMLQRHPHYLPYDSDNEGDLG